MCWWSFSFLYLFNLFFFFDSVSFRFQTPSTNLSNFQLNITCPNDKRSLYQNVCTVHWLGSLSMYWICIYIYIVICVRIVCARWPSYVWNGWFIRSHHVFRHLCFLLHFFLYLCLCGVYYATNESNDTVFQTFSRTSARAGACEHSHRRIWRFNRLECQKVALDKYEID